MPNRTPEIMLGRVVERHSPATLSAHLAPHPEWAQSVILQQMQANREHPKPGQITKPATEPQGPFDPEGQMQTEAYQEYRRGERASYR
jgi:hypothetical protein